MAEVIRKPLMSGFCNFPATNEDSHRRCPGGQRANPEKIFQPCPCVCHLKDERYECECGGELAEAPLLFDILADEGDETVYVHVDPTTHRMIGAYCDDD